MSDLNAINHYLVLGIDEDADRETIRSAFRGLVRRYHPDAGAGSSSTEFRRVVEAYETLSDPERRLVYDRTLVRHRRPPRAVEPLGDRVTVEPIASVWPTSFGYRRADAFARRQVVLDELLDALFRSFEMTVSVGRRGPFCRQSTSTPRAIRNCCSKRSSLR